MLGQNLDNQQQNFTNKSNNQLFKENGSNNKVSASFTKSLNEIDIQVLKRKINGIIQYQKPYIPKLFYEILAKNPENAKIICEYIIAEQNEFNIKESTKEDKIKRLFQFIHHYFKNLFKFHIVFYFL